MTEDIRTWFFPTKQDTYQQSVVAHANENDLKEEVSLEKLQTQSHRVIVRIRNLQNDDVFPFDAEGFIQWFELQCNNQQIPTHPMTREDLSYLKKRVAFKKRCLELKLDHSSEKDAITYLFQHMHDSPYLPLDEKMWFQVCDLLTVAAFERLGMIWTNLTLQTTYELMMPDHIPIHSWLLRTSSRHDHIMPNAEVIVMAIKSAEQVVEQYRYLLVHGVGIYLVNVLEPLTSFRQLVQQRQIKQISLEPDYVTLAELIGNMGSQHLIDAQHFMKPYE